MTPNVIFDLDGTLIDSLPGIAYSVEAALGECGVAKRSAELHAELRLLIGPPIRDILATVTGVSDHATLDALLAAFRRSYDSEGWRRTVLQGSAKAMLAELAAAGAALWIVTNKPALSSGMILEELGVAQCFREIVCRDSRTPPFASKAEMLADLLHRRGLSAEECLMVGDTLEDCHAAVAAGIRCAIVPHGYGTGLAGELPPGCFRIGAWSDLIQCYSK